MSKFITLFLVGSLAKMAGPMLIGATIFAGNYRSVMFPTFRLEVVHYPGINENKHKKSRRVCQLMTNLKLIISGAYFLTNRQIFQAS